MSWHIRKSLTTVFVFAVVVVAASSIAVAQTDNGALKKDDVVKTIRFMKQTNSSDQEIAQVISNAGVGFKPTKDDEEQLRRAGASDLVIAAVRDSYRGEEKPPQNDPPPVTENKNETKPPKVKPPKTQTASDKRDETANEVRPNNDPRERTEKPKQQKQDKDIKFNVGDRVEVDTFMRGDYPDADKNATWRVGTVVRIENPADRLGAYVVEVDEDGNEMHIRFRTRDVRWIRAPQGPQ